MPLEIERKFLVAYVPPDDEWPVPFEDVSIIQHYLQDIKPGESERVRRSQVGSNPPKFFLTRKKYVSPGVCQEDEELITEQEFEIFSLSKKSNKIHKVRRVFDWGGLTWELDQFIQPGGIMLMEVELSGMEEEVALPPFIQIHSEVTADNRYSNSEISKNGIP